MKNKFRKMETRDKNKDLRNQKMRKMRRTRRKKEREANHDSA